MATAVLQIVHAVVALSFGLAALRVAASLRHQPLYATGWRWTGGVFATWETHSLLQSLFAAAAFVSGPGSAPWDRYLAWAPALNHSRTAALVVAFPVLAGLVGVRRRAAEHATPGRRRWITGAAYVAAGGAAGAWLGISEGSILSPHHFTRGVMMAALELVVLLGVLFLLLVQDRLDRLLWCALAVYALQVAVNIFLISGVKGFGVDDGWKIAPVHTALFSTLLSAAMLAGAAVRLRRVRRGRVASGLLPAVRRRDPPHRAAAP